MLLVLAGLGAAFFVLVIHADPAQLRQARGGFHLDGVIAIIACWCLGALTLLMLGGWRLLAFHPTSAAQHLRKWIALFLGLAVFVNLPLLYSAGVERLVRAGYPYGFFNPILAGLTRQDGDILFFSTVWPLPVAFALWRYRIKFAHNDAKNVLN